MALREEPSTELALCGWHPWIYAPLVGQDSRNKCALFGGMATEDPRERSTSLFIFCFCWMVFGGSSECHDVSSRTHILARGLAPPVIALGEAYCASFRRSPDNNFTVGFLCLSCPQRATMY